MSTTPQILYRTTNSAAASLEGQPRPKLLLPKDCPIQFSAFAFEQDFQVAMTNFPFAPKNTPATSTAVGISSYTPSQGNVTSSNAILTTLTTPANTGAGWGKTTGSFAAVPATWNEYVTQTVNFPGIINNYFAGKARAKIARDVTVRIQNDYFVVDADSILTSYGLLDSAGNVAKLVASKGQIPIIARTPWLCTINTGSAFVANPYLETEDLVQTGGYSPSATFGVYLESCPPSDIYVQWCAVATAFKTSGAHNWDLTHPPCWNGTDLTTTTYGQYVLKSSSLVEYAGNIVCRATTYAMPE